MPDPKSPPDLQLISGHGAFSERLPTGPRAAPDSSTEVLRCRRCGGPELIESHSGVQFGPGFRLQGGTTQLICLACLTRGKRVVVVEG